MALQLRYGTYEDFHPEKMTTAEPAVVISGDPAVSDGRSVYVCFTPGVVKRLTTYADFERELEESSQEIREQFTQDIKDAIKDALAATNSANAAAEAANKAADDIKQAAANGDYSATIESVSVVTGEPGTEAKVENTGTKQKAAFKFTIPKGVKGDKGDKGDTGSVENIGGQVITFSTATMRANISPTDTLSVAFGKLAKYCADLESGAASTLLGNNLSGSMALVSDADGKIAAHETVSAAELGYLDGIKSNIQSQIDKLYSDMKKLNIKNDNMRADFGIETSTTLEQLVSLLPNGARANIWVNDLWAFGKEIRDDIRSKYPSDSAYGYMEIVKAYNGDTTYFWLRDYTHSNAMYYNTYSKVNNVGWAGWTRTKF